MTGFRVEFADLIENRVDIIFANEDEIKSLYQVDSFEEAIECIRPLVKIAALTRSEKGCVIISGDETHTVPAAQTDVVDTTGAGDLFAAGFLYGHTNGYDLEQSARIAVQAASSVLGQLGARPEGDLKDHVDAGLKQHRP